MKAEFVRSFGVGLLAATLATAGAKLPKGVYAASDLGAACEEAAKQGKGVALLLADSGAKQEKAIESTTTALRSLKGHSVVVYVEAKGDDMSILPPPAVTALQDIKLGAFIPRTAVTSPDLLEVWATATGTALGGDDARKALSRVKSEVSEKAKSWKPGADPLQKLFKWGAKENKVFEGRFDGLEDERMLIVDKNDRKGSVELEKLTEASIAYAKKLQALSSEAQMPTFAIEDWTSSDGRTLKAKFVSLEDGKITLEMAGGKKVTFPLKRLDKASAGRAEEHAAAVIFAGGG